MKLMVTDWRNPAAWSKKDRNRTCSRASVSNVWTTNPFGIRPVETLVAIQPGVLFWEGAIAGSEETYNRTLGEIAQRADLWLRNPAGSIVNLWEWGPQKVQALDLTRPETRDTLSTLAPAFFNFAHGLHLDYYCTLAWIDPTFPAEFWPTWFQAWTDLVDRLRKARPDWALIGQEWHPTLITDKVDGLFLEDNPTQFTPDGFTEIPRWASSHPSGEDWVIELRYVDRFPLDYRRRVVRLAEEVGCFLSWKRDALAGAGFPP